MPKTISNTVSSTMQIVLASVFTKYLQSISAEPRLESGLSGRHAGVSWMVTCPVIPWHPMGRSSRSLAFPSRNCHSTGSLALDWVVYPHVSQMATFDCEHLSFHVISISFRLSHAETYLMYRKVLSGVPHIFSCKALGLKTRIDVIFLKGRTFFQLCQPFGRLVPNYDELL